MSTKSWVTAVLQQTYGFQHVTLTPTRGGYLHLTWRAATPEGDFLVKAYRGDDWPQQRVAETLAVQHRLAQQGLPVPAVRTNGRGELTTPLPHSITLAVMDFAPGAHLPPSSISPDVARLVGSVLGRMHRALRNLPMSGTRPFIPATDLIIERAAQLLEAARSRPQPDEMDRLAMETAEYRIRAVRQRPVSPADYEHAVFQVVHGDFYPGNLLFDGQKRLTAIIDFDFCGPRWRGLELGRAVVETALRPGGSIDAAVARALVQGYQTENPLPLAERRVIFRLWYDYLLSSTYPLPLRYRGQPLPHGWQRLARRRHDLMVWLGEHLDELEGLT